MYICQGLLLAGHVILEVLEVSQIIPLANSNDVLLKVSHKENSERECHLHLMEKVVTSQEAEAWILGMKKYFQIHDYSRNERDRINIYNLNGRASIWWENLMQVKGVKERLVRWDQFKKYFEEKYLSSRYYDNKRKEFNELKLG